MPLLQLKKSYLCPVNPTKNKSTNQQTHTLPAMLTFTHIFSPFHAVTIAEAGARHYHPALSIWLSVDPMSDKYPGVSPYTYCGNNPVRLVDKDGREFGDYYNWQGKRLGWDGAHNDDVHFISDRKSIKLLKNSNSSVSTEHVEIDVTTTKKIINEALKVYTRASNNGQTKEESTYITTTGKFHATGPNVSELSSEEIPNVCTEYEGELLYTIHSHIPLYKKKGDELSVYTSSALRPSTEGPNADINTHTLIQNVIVGSLGDAEWRTFPSGYGGYWDIPEMGAAFYDSEWNYKGSTTINVLEKIIGGK